MLSPTLDRTLDTQVGSRSRAAEKPVSIEVNYSTLIPNTNVPTEYSGLRL